LQPPQPLPFSSGGPFWEAKITGLQRNTLYYYSIANGPEHTFRTPPPRGNSGFTVYAEGDIGSTHSYFRVGGVQDLIANGAPAFVLAIGDLSYGNNKGMDDVDQHFNDVMAWSRDAAYMPVWGNHEWSKSTDDLRNYKGRFDLPNPQSSLGSPSVSCCGEDWYWFDYGNARFIAYPEPWSGAWADWNTRAAPLMDEAQADPNIKFIVTFGHRPAYSSGHHPGSSTLKGILDGFGDTCSKYVLNINGHSHDYERTYTAARRCSCDRRHRGSWSGDRRELPLAHMCTAFVVRLSRDAARRFSAEVYRLRNSGRLRLQSGAAREER
jgi:Calcineurin-like phosphoesterase